MAIRIALESTCAAVWPPGPPDSALTGPLSMRILIIEDDPQLREIVATGLREAGLETTTAATYHEGLERALLGSYGLVILDVMLPDGDGIALCKALRQASVATPVLLLTARDTVDDKVVGFNAGADDYLAKPFAFRELLARVRALIRRPSALAPALAQVADLEIDLRARQVRRAGQSISLTAKEFALLECFVLHAGMVLDRGTITAHVWDENHDPFTNTLEVLVRRLRQKIDDPFPTKLITTVRGVGYRFGP
jgi:two-component system copper resistance phosphate regulon response regulator CusR